MRWRLRRCPNIMEIKSSDGRKAAALSEAYFASARFFFFLFKIARISALIRRALSRSSTISCGVSRFDAAGGSAVGFGCFGMVYLSQSAPPSARANALCVGRLAAVEHREDDAGQLAGSAQRWRVLREGTVSLPSFLRAVHARLRALQRRGHAADQRDQDGRAVEAGQGAGAGGARGWAGAREKGVNRLNIFSQTSHGT